MLRVAGIVLLLAASAGAVNSAFGENASPQEIMTLELRLLPKAVREGEAIPAPRRFRAPRSVIKNVPQLDADGVFRGSTIVFVFPRTGSAESAPRVDLVTVQFRLGSPQERNLATMIPRAGESPLPGLRAYENHEPQEIGDMFAAEDPEFGAVYAICASIFPSRPPVCAIQIPLDADLVFLTTVTSGDLGDWHSSVRRAREHVTSLLK